MENRKNNEEWKQNGIFCLYPPPQKKKMCLISQIKLKEHANVNKISVVYPKREC